MTKNNDLPVCPVCGALPLMINRYDELIYEVECSNDWHSLSSLSAGSEQEANDAWVKLCEKAGEG